MLSREARDNIVGFMNPFSGTRPRIMDGECFSSSTISHRDTESYVIPQNKTAIFYIQADIMVPLVFQTDITSSTINFSRASADVMRWDTSSMPSTTGGGIIEKQGDIDRWRHVSSGIKLALLNTAETNDGWWEAYRVTSTPEIDQLVLQEYPAALGTGALVPAVSWFDSLSNNIQFNRERHSYCAGALKDIDKYMFTLKPIQKDHTLNHMYHNYKTLESAAYVGPAPQQWQISRTTGLSWKPIYDSQRDFTWDALCIVIHAGATSVGSNILLDHNVNLEVMYENTSGLSQYHTPTINSPDLHNAVRQQHAARTIQAAVRTMRSSFKSPTGKARSPSLYTTGYSVRKSLPMLFE
jgi:hypothetical protein